MSAPTVYIYIYMCMAKASFSAYVLGKNLLKTGEKVHLLEGRKSTTNSGRAFSSFPFPFLGSKWLKYAVFLPFKAKKSRQKTRPPIYIYIYIEKERGRTFSRERERIYKECV